MASISISFNAENTETSPNNGRSISVYATGVETDELLNEIGKDEAKSYFNLVDEKELDEANDTIKDLEKLIEDLKNNQ